MSRSLQLELKPGDQIIATETAYYDYSPEIAAQKKISQRPGKILMVNNPHVTRSAGGEVTHAGDSVSGTGIFGPVEAGERGPLGLGGSLKVGTFRRATPADPGFMGTRETWFKFERRALTKLQAQAFAFGALFGAVCAAVLIQAIGR